MSLVDENGRSRAVLGNASVVDENAKTVKYPVASLILLDPMGMVTWHTPQE